MICGGVWCGSKEVLMGVRDVKLLCVKVGGMGILFSIDLLNKGLYFVGLLGSFGRRENFALFYKHVSIELSSKFTMHSYT